MIASNFMFFRRGDVPHVCEANISRRRHITHERVYHKSHKGFISLITNPSTNASVGPPPFRQGRLTGVDDVTTPQSFASQNPAPLTSGVAGASALFCRLISPEQHNCCVAFVIQKAPPTDYIGGAFLFYHVSGSAFLLLLIIRTIAAAIITTAAPIGARHQRGNGLFSTCGSG